MKKTLPVKQAFWIGLLALFAILPNIGCDDDCPTQNDCVPSDCKTTRSALVLNEGNFQTNNSTLTYYSINCQFPTQNYFQEKIGRLLGDTGNDMILVNKMLYIVVNNSHRLEVVDITDWSLVASIEMSKDATGSSPREILEHNGKLFITNFNGYVAVVDTANNYQNAIEWIKVGTQPEGITKYNNMIYVANSNYNEGTNPGSISVIDPSSLTVTETFENVGHNISGLESDNYGDLYVISRGNYSDISASLEVFNTMSKKIDTSFSVGAQMIRIEGDEGFVSIGGYDANWKFVASVAKFDVKADTIITDELIASSNFQTLFGINIDPENGDIYCTDARDYSVSGDVICFDNTGTKKFEFKSGISPCKVLFYSN